MCGCQDQRLTLFVREIQFLKDRYAEGDHFVGSGSPLYNQVLIPEGGLDDTLLEGRRAFNTGSCGIKRR